MSDIVCSDADKLKKEDFPAFASQPLPRNLSLEAIARGDISSTDVIYTTQETPQITDIEEDKTNTVKVNVTKRKKGRHGHVSAALVGVSVIIVVSISIASCAFILVFRNKILGNLDLI